MKFQPDAVAGTSITGYGAGWIAVNGERFDSSIVICSSGERFAWNCDTFDALQAAAWKPWTRRPPAAPSTFWPQKAEKWSLHFCYSP